MKVVAIDLGLKRIGLALSVMESIVTPLDAVMRKNRNQASSEVREVIKEWGVDTVVVGIPLGGSSEEEMRRRVEHFMKLVAFEGRVYMQDEAGTSLEAEERMKGKIRQKKDGKVDSIAAQIILERWLNSSQKIVLDI